MMLKGGASWHNRWQLFRKSQLVEWFEVLVGVVSFAVQNESVQSRFLGC